MKVLHGYEGLRDTVYGAVLEHDLYEKWAVFLQDLVLDQEIFGIGFLEEWGGLEVV